MRVLDGEKLVSGQSLATSYNGPAISYQHLWVAGIQLRWSGAPVGNFKLQISLVGDPTDDTVWIDVDGTTVAAGGTSGKHYYQFSQNCSAKFLRVVYTAASGTGSLDLWAEGKGV